MQKENPDVVHCHNTFPLISPSIYWACAKEGVPVVQTLHNYRLLCLNAFLFRQSRCVKGYDLGVKDNLKLNHLKPNTSAGSGICELCLRRRFKFQGIRHSCYRDSRAASLVVAVMLFVHKLLGTWSKKVTAYIALTEFQKQKMIEGGIPADKVWVKPNFIQRSEVGGQSSDDRRQTTEQPQASNPQPPTPSSYALFVGRLSPEKGCDVLIRAWARFEAVWGREHGAEGFCPVLT